MKAVVSLEVKVMVEMTPEQLVQLEDDWRSFVAMLNGFDRYVMDVEVEEVQFVSKGISPLSLLEGEKAVHVPSDGSISTGDDEVNNIIQLL